MLFTDLSPFLGEFGVDAITETYCVIRGVLDADYVGVGDGAEVDSSAPALLCASADVSAAGIVYGATLTIDSVGYVVRSIRPDGTGMTALILDYT